MKLLSFLFAASALPALVLCQDGPTPNKAAQECADKAQGDQCVYTVHGSSAYGECISPDDPSACGAGYTPSDKCLLCSEGSTGPADGDGPSGGNDGIKVQPSVAACSDSSEGDSCAFVSADGSKMTGTCTDEGAGACGPVSDSSDSSTACYVCNSQPTDNTADGTGTQNENECTGLSIGDSCTITRPSGDIIGECSDTNQDLDTGDGHLACVPTTDQKPDPPPGTTTSKPIIFDGMQQACKDLSENDSCSYTMGSDKFTGTCLDNGNGSLECDDQSTNGESADSTALESACSSKSEGDSCTAELGDSVTVSVDGKCQKNEANSVLFCNVIPDASATPKPASEPNAAN